MHDQIVLLEQRKEVTTFLLDDGDVTSKDVVTETGQSIGYDYTNKLYPEDTVKISDKSEIGKEMVKKYTGSNDEIPIGIVVNDPTVMDNGQRKASVLVLGQLYMKTEPLKILQANTWHYIQWKILMNTIMLIVLN